MALNFDKLSFFLACLENGQTEQYFYVFHQKPYDAEPLIFY